MTRKEAREQAFILLFEQTFQPDKPMAEIWDDAAEVRDCETSGFVRRLVFGTESRREEADRLIEENLKGWSIRRISRVALAVLRLSVYEICFEPETPLGVAINEAVELAKKYAGEKDAAYINGVLSSIAKSREEDHV